MSALGIHQRRRRNSSFSVGCRTKQIFFISIFIFICVKVSCCQISSIEEQPFRTHESRSSYVEIPGAFQYRDILFVPESDSAIVTSTDHLYKISLSSFRELVQSDWLPSSSFIEELVNKDIDGWWRMGNVACSMTELLGQRLDQSKIDSWEKLTNITCRWYFHAMSPIQQGKFWACFSKQTISGCVEFDVTTLQPTDNSYWPANSTDPAFYGSFPESPWLTTRESRSIVTFNPVEDKSQPRPTFIGYGLGQFSVSNLDLTDPLFSQLFGVSESFPVKSFRINDFIYFFFHDNAYEARSSYYDFDEPEREYRRYSRVARFCAKEVAGGSKPKIMVARLVCGISKKGYSPEHQFEFENSGFSYQYFTTWNVITDVTFETETERFYATFTNNYLPKGSLGSSLCVYNLSAIDQIFDSGKIKQPRNTRENAHLSWELYAGSIPANLGTCANTDETPPNTTSGPDDQNVGTNYLPIAHKWIEPMTGSILAFSNTHNFQSLDSVTSANYTFIHVVTNELKLLKLTVDRLTLKTHVTHSIQLPKVSTGEFSDGLFNDNFTYFIKSYDNNVYVGSTWSLFKAPMSLCSTFTSCSDCLLTSRDLECRWHSSNQKCFSIFDQLENTDENDVMSKEQLMTSQLNKSCPAEDSLNKTYHITFLPPLPSEQAPSPVFSASEITLFCGANFRIESLSKNGKSLENTEMNLPNARWYENSRDISQGVGKCGSVGVNVLSCNDSISILGSPVESQTSEGVLQTISGFTYSILRVSAHHNANYTCIFHYGPKSFISNSVLLRVKSRKEHVDNVYTSYIEQLKQYYVQTCNMETYCATDGCKVENKNRFQSCLIDQTKNPP